MDFDPNSLKDLLTKLLSRSFEGIDEISVSLQEHNDTKEIWPVVDIIFDYEYYWKQFDESDYQQFNDFEYYITNKVKDILNFVGFDKKKIVVEIYVTNT